MRPQVRDGFRVPHLCDRGRGGRSLVLKELPPDRPVCPKLQVINSVWAGLGLVLPLHS